MKLLSSAPTNSAAKAPPKIFDCSALSRVRQPELKPKSSERRWSIEEEGNSMFLQPTVVPVHVGRLRKRAHEQH